MLTTDAMRVPQPKTVAGAGVRSVGQRRRVQETVLQMIV
jgi:hypothetical protein